MMKINLEFNGTADEIMKEFQALGSILSSAALPSNVKSMNPEALSPDLGSVEQHPKMDAVENTTSAPKKATKAPEKAHPTLEAAPSAPTPEPVKSADPEPVKPAAPEPPAAPVVPTAPAKKYTLDELLAATAPLMDAGKIAELQALMQKFGVPSMMDIPEEKYGELATALRELGAEL
ncbi:MULTISPECIES: hypothetical protein [Megasphaera]|jgi:hypothetical protein|uniref:hypothetical protein n=2 Tax=Megasphaera TaxID=906 RepID=UPI00242C3E95|nr:hypothetical protein [Megasphaera elsdenii]MCI7201240.1 hypothetical protein [Megasphaera elsdenii]MDY4265361.1 hypothetical protein [Megasphaera elsdenii]